MRSRFRPGGPLLGPVVLPSASRSWPASRDGGWHYLSAATPSVAGLATPGKSRVALEAWEFNTREGTLSRVIALQTLEKAPSTGISILQLRIDLTSSMSVGCPGLMLSPPAGPGYHEAGACDRSEQQARDQVADFRHARMPECGDTHAAMTCGLLSFGLPQADRRIWAESPERNASAAMHRLM